MEWSIIKNDFIKNKIINMALLLYLLKNLSIRDNIVLSGFKVGMLSRDKVNQNADELMKKLGIYHVATHDISYP